MGGIPLLSGVLAKANADASSLWVMGRGPMAPLWPSDIGRDPVEGLWALDEPALFPWIKEIYIIELGLLDYDKNMTTIILTNIEILVI